MMFPPNQPMSVHLSAELQERPRPFDKSHSKGNIETRPKALQMPGVCDTMINLALLYPYGTIHISSNLR